MSRGRTTPRPQKVTPEDVIEWREPPAKGNADGLSWASVLSPLLKKQGQWAMIRVFDTPEKAASAQSNLSGRRVVIPQPTHNWSFASRGIELFACYHGKLDARNRPAAPTPRKTAAKVAAAASKTKTAASKTAASKNGAKSKTAASKSKTATSKTRGRDSGRSVR
jgi:hypothetical protein